MFDCQLRLIVIHLVIYLVLGGSSADARRAGRAELAAIAARDQFVPFVQLTIQHLCDFGDGMVGDAGANPHRLQSLVRTEFPDDSHIHPRSIVAARSVSAATLSALACERCCLAAAPVSPDA